MNRNSEESSVSAALNKVQTYNHRAERCGDELFFIYESLKEPPAKKRLIKIIREKAATAISECSKMSPFGHRNVSGGLTPTQEKCQRIITAVLLFAHKANCVEGLTSFMIRLLQGSPTQSVRAWLCVFLETVLPGAEQSRLPPLLTSICVKALLDRAKDKSPLAREFAARAAAKWKDLSPKLCSLLVVMLRTDPAPEVRGVVLKHIELGCRTDAFLPAFCERTRDTDPENRLIAFEKLAGKAPDMPREALFELVCSGLEDHDKRVRDACLDFAASSLLDDDFPQSVLERLCEKDERKVKAIALYASDSFSKEVSLSDSSLFKIIVMGCRAEKGTIERELKLSEEDMTKALSRLKSESAVFHEEVLKAVRRAITNEKTAPLEDKELSALKQLIPFPGPSPLWPGVVREKIKIALLVHSNDYVCSKVISEGNK